MTNDNYECPPSGSIDRSLVDHDLVTAVWSFKPPLSRATIAVGVIMSEAGRCYPVADWRTKLDAIECAVRTVFNERTKRTK